MAPPHPLDLLLLRQHGVISRYQAGRLLSLGAIRRRLESGTWRQVHRGIYLAGGPVLSEAVLSEAVLSEAVLSEAQRRVVASLAADAPVGGLTALQLLGLRDFPSGPVHVLLSGQRRHHNPPPYVVVHRTGGLAPGDLEPGATPPCTTAARSLVDAAQWAGSDQKAAVVVAAAVRQRLVGPVEVTAAVDRQPRARRRALVLEVARNTGGAHSLPEAELVRLCRRAGLPTPACQIRDGGAPSRRHYLEACFEEYGVQVEIDDQPSAEVPVGRPDRVLRIPAWQVLSRPDEIAGLVGQALTAAGWRTAC